MLHSYSYEVTCASCDKLKGVIANDNCDVDCAEGDTYTLYIGGSQEKWNTSADFITVVKFKHTTIKS